jgi:hypothetical protein
VTYVTVFFCNCIALFTPGSAWKAPESAMAKLTIAGSSRPRASSLFSDAGNLFREVLKALLDPYRPELHYMRGPGPKVARKQHEDR